MNSDTASAWRATTAERLARLLNIAKELSAERETNGAPALAVLGEQVAELAERAMRELGLDAHASPARSKPLIDHLGIAVHDLPKAARFFVDLLGGRLVAGGINREAGLRTVFVEYPGGGKLELLQPTAHNPMKRFLEKRGEGVHHMTFMVADLAAALALLKAAGYRIVDEDLASATWKEAYVSPRDAHGCLVQLVEAGPGYETQVTGIALEDVLADRWQWVDQRPTRVR